MKNMKFTFILQSGAKVDFITKASNNGVPLNEHDMNRLAIELLEQIKKNGEILLSEGDQFVSFTTVVAVTGKLGCW